MNETDHNADFDKELENALGEPSPPDFAAWREAHGNAVACLNPQYTTVSMNRSRNMKRLVKFACTIALVAAVVLGTSFLSGYKTPNAAYADIVAQAEQAKTIQWKTTFYSEATGVDGKTKWIDKSTRHFAYKAPGLFRDARVDENGNVIGATITDYVKGVEYGFNNITKKAALIELTFVPRKLSGSPFDWLTNQKDGKLHFVEKKHVDGREVNVFRHIRKDVDTPFRGEIGKRDWSYDYWLDAKTKKLVRVQVPGTDMFDPQTDPIRDVPPQKQSSMVEALASVQHDFVFDAELDDELFRTAPPEGFEFEVKKRSYISEPEMIEFLGVLAEFRGGRFPKKTVFWPGMNGELIPVGYSNTEINLIYEKPDSERSAVEQKLLDIVDHCKMNHLNLLPFRHFINDFTADGTWRYAGKGVKLGDANRIVCWYQLKKTGQYRAVYGDLTVKDIAADDLPDDPKP